MRHLFSDRKMGKSETGLEGNLVTAHEISNINSIENIVKEINNEDDIKKQKGIVKDYAKMI